MKRMHVAVLLAALAGILIMSSALAMASTNYRIDWFVPLPGGGLRNLSSPSYAADGTLGQTGINTGGSSNYMVGWGFWYGIVQGNIVVPSYTIQLPIVINH